MAKSENVSAESTQGVRAVILSVSSDIGLSLAGDWLDKGIDVVGTYRTDSRELDDLRKRGLETFHLDLDNEASVLEVGNQLSITGWSRLVLAAGTQEPIGLFSNLNLQKWGESVSANFTRQFQFLGAMLPGRTRVHGDQPRVLAFAGGATNRATTHYSAYTISKIASIKMVELLAAEIPDTGFMILGPGWVETKIHKATLAAGLEAGDNLEETNRHFKEGDFYSMEELIASINWLFNAPIELVTGRNFSAVFDPWGQDILLNELRQDEQLYKLRRFGNDRFQ